ncbi:THO complex subunit 3 [Leucoagaricus sp. SymC.cos]|nr:THO complex subunit 3 [Leucoagaricus sp. SymC.cos]
MASTPADDELTQPQKPPSPPPHTTFAARGIHPPNFSAFKPKDFRHPTTQAITHVAWNCDGKKLAGVGIDKTAKVWNPDKPVGLNTRLPLEYRSATAYSGGHSDDVDYVSWNPTHPELFCTSSQKDRRIVFWDARQSRFIQQCSLKVTPTYTQYSLDGRSLLFVTAAHQLMFMSYGKEAEDTKEQWAIKALPHQKDSVGSKAIFNHTGDGLVVAFHSEHTLRVLDYPSLEVRDSPAAHVGGCMALALDPRGRYLASGGLDSIVNLFDMRDWIVARTITACEHSINDLSFSHDGEFLAIASTGSYIDICAVETAAPLHRIPALTPSPTVSWHPSKYAVAYCGQIKAREGGPPPAAIISILVLRVVIIARCNPATRVHESNDSKPVPTKKTTNMRQKRDIYYRGITNGKQEMQIYESKDEDEEVSEMNADDDEDALVERAFQEIMQKDEDEEVSEMNADDEEDALVERAL